ncbi:T9SS type A sorting domain-containing protein [Pontibacter actiniarum]|uniref:T9SS C-terminal target domain-containing protein n=1 Tax=Pontibacter actiniarum TaxID=323450 RepID=A0A1X9YWF9_9BACT|nr:T9SS type A sorting domain-containing protein [Pontibacter actiniarum]ARS37280.1 T9SS C-terminal target domain-containing protein [Pontibacter actiniarum]
MKATLHAYLTIIALALAIGTSQAQSTIQEPTIDGTLDTYENLEVGEDYLWQVFVRPYDYLGDSVNLEIQLLNPELRDNFTLLYNSNREAQNEEEATYSQVEFNEAGFAMVGPPKGEKMEGNYREYFKINFAEEGVYGYKLTLRRRDGTDLARLDESVQVGTVAGIDDMIGGTRVAVYPTVSEGAVRLNLGQIRNASVAVVDMLGRKVLEVSKANGIVEINTQDYARGTYFVKVFAEDDVASSRLIVR